MRKSIHSNSSINAPEKLAEETILNCETPAKTHQSKNNTTSKKHKSPKIGNHKNTNSRKPNNEDSTLEASIEEAAYKFDVVSKTLTEYFRT